MKKCCILILKLNLNSLWKVFFETFKDGERNQKIITEKIEPKLILN